MPFVYASTILMSVGACMLTTWVVSTSAREWIGYQIIFGFGAGFGFQHAIVAAQAVLPAKDIPTGTTVVLFYLLPGGTVMVSAGQNVFANALTSGLGDIPGIDAEAVIAQGATSLKELVGDPDVRARALEVYNSALTDVFKVSVGKACASALGALGTEWKSVKQKKVGERGDGGGA